MYHGGSFADIDEDGRPEIAIGSYDDHLYVFNDDSTVEWSVIAPYYIGAPTSIADLNGDQHLEIVFTTYNQLRVMSYDGVSMLWSHSTGGSIFRGAAIADIDGDGVLDVVFGSDDGILRVLRGSDGAVVWTYDLEAHYGQTFEMDHAPVIADFDGDAKLDVFIIGGHGTSSQPQNNHGRAYALQGGDGAGAGWPMFRHDLRHSACFHGPWTGAEEWYGQNEAIQARLRLIGKPNPFTVSTEIILTGSNDRKVDVLLYDTAGRLVRSFPILLSNGQGTATWDRKDASGHLLPSGVYMGFLEHGPLTDPCKLIIVE
jgi:hypothetical protein